MSDPVRRYVTRTEGLIRPAEAALISIFGSLLGRAPVGVQRAIMTSSTKKNPWMGFVVDPYAFFLAHRIRDVERAQALLPDDYRIADAAVFEGGTPEPTVVFGAFSVRTSAFQGDRVEMYVIAEHVPTGLLSWVIVDYDSNTLSFDPGKGFVDGNTRRCVVTTTHRAQVLVDVECTRSGRRVAATADLRQAQERPLDQRLWLEGNLSVGYGRELDDGSPPFGLRFDPGEMERALFLPREALTLDALTWHEGLYEPEPSVIAVFPYAQHFITSQIPTASAVRTRADLEAFVADFNQGPAPEGFSSRAIKRSMIIGLILSTLTTYGLAGFVAVHFWLAH